MSRYCANLSQINVPNLMLPAQLRRHLAIKNVANHNSVDTHAQRLVISEILAPKKHAKLKYE
jgi:hypothetical protein